jgi:CRP-like cAMP-binding protein
MFGHRTQPDSTEVQAIADRLGTVSFFEGFTADEIHRVAQLAERVVAEPGAVIIDQGRVGLECFVILEGAASVYISGEHVATLTPGAMVTDTLDLAAFNTDGFKKLLAEMPNANDRVMETLAARLKANTDHA